MRRESIITNQRAPLRVAAKRILPAAAMLLVLGLAGCGQTERMMTITSEPAGALVHVNGVYKGRTPVSFEFLWYGDYDVELSLPGYETLKDHRNVQAPAHEWVGVDLVKTVFVPMTVCDRQAFHFTLSPMPAVSDAEMIERANALKDETLHTGN